MPAYGHIPPLQGSPVHFETWAPYEWSAPYHQWLLKDMELLLRRRLGLPGLETLHLAHILVEQFREWIVGGARKPRGGDVQWRQAHCSTVMPDGRPARANYVVRLEFQMGDRIPGTQDYHGRGTVHLHGVIFLETLRGLDLEKKVEASIPAQGHPLRGYVLSGQDDRKAESGVEIREEPSDFDAATEQLRLHHSAEDAAAGIRPFRTEALDVMKCHMDVMTKRDTGNFMRYLTSYSAKMSDSLHQDLLSDAGGAYNLARRVLFSYHPPEPEMWLTIAAQQFPQFAAGGSMKPILAPWPGMPAKSAEVLLYEASPWAGRLSLLNFLRRTNEEGQPIAWIVKDHKRCGSTKSLNEFVEEVQPYGEKLIAAEVVSMLSDKFYGQWLALNEPFKQLEDFILPEVVARVPEKHRNLALALKRDPHFWRSEAKVTEYMQLRAHRDMHIRTVLSMISVTDGLIL